VHSDLGKYAKVLDSVIYCMPSAPKLETITLITLTTVVTKTCRPRQIIVKWPSATY